NNYLMYLLTNICLLKLVLIEREVEIQAIGMKHTEIISQRDKSSATIGTLFNRDKHGFIPQIVVLQGAAGIGKTIMAKKIMLDWASKQIYRSQFFYAFYISCREMNLHAESEKSSIAEIISKQWPRCHEVENVIPGILKNVKELLFIIDGFDELRYSFDQIILKSLFQKKLLPESSLIITTRPIILGFSRKGREEYFCKFFGEENKDQATQAFRFVTQNDTLFTMCVIPLVSWIICTVIKQEMERGMDLQKTPCTLTAIYMLYLSSLLKFHHKESKENIQRKLKSFCSLAAEGIRKKQILFMEEEVKKHSLDQEQSLSLFLNQNIFKRDIHCIQTFSFIHLSFQEFFAALFCVLEGREKWHSQNPDRNLQTLLQRHDIYFESVFAVGFRFLFGFLNEENRMKDLKKDFRWQISDKSKDLLLKWIKDNINIKIYKIGLNWITQDNPTLYLYNSFNKRIHFYLEKEMLSYLYETQDENFVRNARSGTEEERDGCAEHPQPRSIRRQKTGSRMQIVSKCIWRERSGCHFRAAEEGGLSHVLRSGGFQDGEGTRGSSRHEGNGLA
uniref:NACHT domain-containing protein n=1 Tax=Naja naja TaxID=35670 RepID=A0A8C6V9U7_NAJNA